MFSKERNRHSITRTTAALAQEVVQVCWLAPVEWTAVAVATVRRSGLKTTAVAGLVSRLQGSGFIAAMCAGVTCRWNPGSTFVLLTVPELPCALQVGIRANTVAEPWLAAGVSAH